MTTGRTRDDPGGTPFSHFCGGIVTVHLLATHVETGETYEAVLDNGEYCLVTHGQVKVTPGMLPRDYRSVTLTKATTGAP